MTANRVKVKKEPVDYGKYLRPLKKVLPVAGVILAVVTVMCFAYKALSRVTFFSLDRIEVAQGERSAVTRYWPWPVWRVATTAAT